MCILHVIYKFTYLYIKLCIYSYHESMFYSITFWLNRFDSPRIYFILCIDTYNIIYIYFFLFRLVPPIWVKQHNKCNNSMEEFYIFFFTSNHILLMNVVATGIIIKNQIISKCLKLKLCIRLKLMKTHSAGSMFRKMTYFIHE